MSFVIQFPEPEFDRTIETPLMVRTVRRTMAVHGGNGIVVWTGPARNGKTRTAMWMVAKIDDACDTSPNGFRAVHYEVGEIPATWGGGEQKRGIRSLWHATIGKMPDTLYRQYPPEALAAELVHALQALNIQMILVDEAGLLSVEAMRGMTLVIDTAQLRGWPLTLVFIGMDELPITVRRVVQVQLRVHEWCYFEPYSIDDTLEFLAALHPHFATLDLSVPAHRAQVGFVHEQFGGLPGLIVPFLRRLTHMEHEVLRSLGRSIDVAFLRAVHMRTHLDEQRSVREAEGREGPQVSTGRSSRTAGRKQNRLPASAPSRRPKGSANSGDTPVRASHPQQPLSDEASRLPSRSAQHPADRETTDEAPAPGTPGHDGGSPHHIGRPAEHDGSSQDADGVDHGGDATAQRTSRTEGGDQSVTADPRERRPGEAA